MGLNEKICFVKLIISAIYFKKRLKMSFNAYFCINDVPQKYIFKFLPLYMEVHYEATVSLALIHLYKCNCSNTNLIVPHVF